MNLNSVFELAKIQEEYINSTKRLNKIVGHFGFSSPGNSGGSGVSPGSTSVNPRKDFTTVKWFSSRDKFPIHRVSPTEKKEIKKK